MSISFPCSFKTYCTCLRRCHTLPRDINYVISKHLHTIFGCVAFSLKINAKFCMGSIWLSKLNVTAYPMSCQHSPFSAELLFFHLLIAFTHFQHRSTSPPLSLMCHAYISFNRIAKPFKILF